MCEAEVGNVFLVWGEFQFTNYCPRAWAVSLTLSPKEPVTS